MWHDGGMHCTECRLVIEFAYYETVENNGNILLCSTVDSHSLMLVIACMGGQASRTAGVVDMITPCHLRLR